ncbi:MAG: transporter, family, methylenomycin resistance protein [Solirubrobacterales bacterium]|jgi:DHA2 family methylenomycin A resistance protein-like MFS transporter|nr:transporter, family, methylenomycin resistance protein [Solirubrobacterales bacterium]
MTVSPTRVLFAASLGFFVVIVDVTIVNVALPSIGDDLGASLSDLQWVVDAYVVTFAALLLSSGALGDRIGVARTYSAGMIAFTLASLACGAAPSLGVLLGARVVQGAAAALLLPSSLALVRLAYEDPGDRAKGIATWAAVGGIALAAGPVLGGLLTSAADWRWIFFLNLPVGVIAVVANVHGPRSARVRTPLDLPGQAAAIVGVGALTFAVIEAGHRGVGSAAALSAFAIFALAAAAFVTIERGSAHPAVPFNLFRTPMVGSAIVTGLLFNFAFYGQVFVLSLYFQDVLGHDALVAGLMFLPLTALIAGVNIGAGVLTSRHGPRPPLIAGELTMAIGLLGMLALDASSPTWLVLVLLVPMGVGGGLAIPPLTAALLEALPPERAGLTSGVFNAARQFGGGLGVALFGGLIAGGFVAGMHVALALGAAGVLVGLGLTVAYIDPPSCNCGLR